MSDQRIPLTDLERGPSAKFPTIGTKYTGTITSARRLPQTDFDTGEVLKWTDGSDREQTVIGLRLADGSETTLYARGGKYEVAEGHGSSMEAAIVAAVRSAGGDAIEVGARLAVEHTGLSKVTRRGMNAAKLYSAQYEPAKQSVPVGDLFSDDAS